MRNKILLVFCLVLTIKSLKALECEVGRNKPTYHTSHDTSDEHPSSWSVDGDLNTYSLSYGYNRTTWLQIDLGQEYMITRMVLSNIYSSSTIDTQRLKSFNIEVSNRVSSLDLKESYYSTIADYVIPLSLTIRNTKQGRYVHVYKITNNNREPLVIAEINIYAEIITASIQTGYECEVASGKSASQISSPDYRQANLAIDGILDTCSKTSWSSNNLNTWLQVDLFQNYLVVKVVVSNVNYKNADNFFLRNFAIFVRQTNETTYQVGNAFGSTDTDITADNNNPASPSIVFIKSGGEWGRFVTVVKGGSTFIEPLVIADLAVFANINSIPTYSTTATTTSKTTSATVVLPIQNETLENRLQQCTSNFQRQETEINSLKTDKIVIGVVVGVLAIIIGTILGFLCGYRFQKKNNAIPATYETTNDTIPATYETTKIQNTDPHVYAGIDNTALQQIDHYDNENKL